MRFLIDRCAGRRLAGWLRSMGHDVVESRELGPDPGDLALLQLSVRESRVLVTMDKDFATLVFAAGTAHSGIVRLPDVPASVRISLMEQILADFSAQELTASIVTVRGNRVRISRSSPGDS